MSVVGQNGWMVSKTRDPVVPLRGGSYSNGEGVDKLVMMHVIYLQPSMHTQSVALTFDLNPLLERVLNNVSLEIIAS